MKKSSTYKEMEKETFRLFYRDGIFDLSFGSMLIIYSINIYLDMIGIITPLIMRILIIPVVILFALIKTFVTTPRIGSVKFRRGRNLKRLITFVIASTALIITTIVYILAASGKMPSGTNTSVISLAIEVIFLLGVFSSLAYFTDYTNFYIIGLAMVIGSPVSIFLEPYLGSRIYGTIIQFFAGFYLFIAGGYQFITFFDKFPKLNYDE